MDEIVSTVTEPTIDLSVEQLDALLQIRDLLAVNNDLLTHIYAMGLWLIGIGGALFVLFMLYKFIKLFY